MNSLIDFFWFAQDNQRLRRFTGLQAAANLAITEPRGGFKVSSSSMELLKEVAKIRIDSSFGTNVLIVDFPTDSCYKVAEITSAISILRVYVLGDLLIVTDNMTSVLSCHITIERVPNLPKIISAYQVALDELRKARLTRKLSIDKFSIERELIRVNGMPRTNPSYWGFNTDE